MIEIASLSILKKSIRLALITTFAFFLVHEMAIISDGLIDVQSHQADVAVIFGSKVNEDGTISERLRARLEKGFKLYASGQVDQIYVSGGLGKEGHLEGSVMKEYLIGQGVHEHLIVVDNEGINTRATALNFTRDFPENTSAIVVTQFFHVSRSKLAFKQVGVSQVAASHCNFYEWRDLYSLVREFFGFYKYLIAY